jgi:hypothetical protein
MFEVLGQFAATTLHGSWPATTLEPATGNGPVRRQPVSGPVVLNDNGAWSWFQDERAVVDARAGTLLVSSVANDDLLMTSYDPMSDSFGPVQR